MEESNSKTKEEPLKTCFVIMPISDVDGYPKGHFDRVYKHIIEPACRLVTSQSEQMKHQRQMSSL